MSLKARNWSRSQTLVAPLNSSGTPSLPGYTATLEGLSSYAYGLSAGLGDTEYSITGFPGIFLTDQKCYANSTGVLHQWYSSEDTSERSSSSATQELWDFSKQEATDIVLINLGTNDQNSANGPVPPEEYEVQYKLLVEGVHTVWPDAQIILTSIWLGFGPVGNTYAQSDAGFVPQILGVYEYFNSPQYLQNPILYDYAGNKSQKPCSPFVHYFNTTGLMQHNDIGPQWHPTDTGHIKLASNLIQYIKLAFSWILHATGPEFSHDTTYWDDTVDYQG